MKTVKIIGIKEGYKFYFDNGKKNLSIIYEEKPEQHEFYRIFHNKLTEEKKTIIEEVHDKKKLKEPRSKSLEIIIRVLLSEVMPKDTKYKVIEYTPEHKKPKHKKI